MYNKLGRNFSNIQGDEKFSGTRELQRRLLPGPYVSCFPFFSGGETLSSPNNSSSSALLLITITTEIVRTLGP